MSSIPPSYGVVSSSLLFGREHVRKLDRSRHGPGGSCPGRRQIDQIDADLMRHVENAVVAVKFAVDDALDARVGDQLEAGPAGARGRVDVRPFDAHAVS